MNQNRRTVLKASSGLTVLGLAVAAGLIKPNEVFAAAGYPEKAFGAKSLDELMKALGAGMPTESKDITVIAPDIAENGAVVPVGADSSTSWRYWRSTDCRLRHASSRGCLRFALA